MSVYTIFGATGLQGKSVALTLAEHLGPKAHIRAITRDPTSTKSQQLKDTVTSLGAQLTLVKHDLSQQTTAALESALQGTEYLFLNSDSFALREEETRIMREVVDAAVALPNLRLLLWSTLPDASKISGGKYTGVKHFQQKARVDEHLHHVGQKIPWVGLQLGWFAENVGDYHLLTEEADGTIAFKYAIATAETAVPWTWITKELGVAALKLFEKSATVEGLPEDVLRKSLPVCGWRATFGEVVAEFERQTGRKYHYETLGGWGNPELDDMNRFFRDFGLYEDWTVPADPLRKIGVPSPTLSEFVSDYLVGHKV